MSGVHVVDDTGVQVVDGDGSEVQVVDFDPQGVHVVDGDEPIQLVERPIIYPGGGHEPIQMFSGAVVVDQAEEEKKE